MAEFLDIDEDGRPRRRRSLTAEDMRKAARQAREAKELRKIAQEAQEHPGNAGTPWSGRQETAMPFSSIILRHAQWI